MQSSTRLGRNRRWLAVLLGLPLLATAALPVSATAATAPVRVILDGKALTLDPAPVILNDRTFVPLRGLLEAMGATVTWDGGTRTVEVTKGNHYVRLRLDHQLGCLKIDCTQAAIMDEPARLIDSRTFIPVRFVAQALGAGVGWDDSRRAVVINTAPGAKAAANPIALTGVTDGQKITGPFTLQTTGEGTAVQFLLVNPATGSGPLVAAGSDPSAGYLYTPDPTVIGPRLLVSAVRDSTGHVRYSDPVLVQMAVKPQVEVTGLDAGGLVDGPISFGAKLNFAATQVSFKLTGPSGTSEDLGRVGPGDKFTWYPQVGDNGDRQVVAVAYDRAGNSYSSAPVPVKVQVGYRVSFAGVSEGDTLKGPVTFRPSANFPVESIKYVLDDKVLGWGLSYAWHFGFEANGPHALTVVITATDGTVKTVGPVHFTVAMTPTVGLTGVGPGQVVTGPLTFKVSANMPLISVDYYLSDNNGNLQLANHKGPDDPFVWTPVGKDAGARSVQAIATDKNLNIYKTDKIDFRVYLGKIYGPVPLQSKTDFIALARRLAVANYRQTGIAASLQAAQSLLETGYGQSVPVDKYTGQLSYNLFGVKGTGPAGSIISNTWEEYGGISYRIDDSFRAYHNVDEAWKDHSDFLLVRPWYAPFRAVMTDPVLGAWALKRSGYATDSQYPFKLITIMKTYDLYQLDEVEL